MTSVLIVRGQLVTPWELRPWAELPDSFDVSYLVTPSNSFDASSLPLPHAAVSNMTDAAAAAESIFLCAGSFIGRAPGLEGMESACNV